MDTLIKNATILQSPEEKTILPNSYLGIAEGKITYVSQEEPRETAREVIDGAGMVVLPGFVNTHTHLPMTILRGAADDYELQIWLQEHIFPLEARFDAECVRIGTELALMECLASGTVSISDMYDHCDAIAAAVANSGIKANLSRGITAFDPDFSFWKSAAGQEARELHRQWDGYDHGRIRVEMSIHGEYTSGPDLWRDVGDYAAEYGLGIHLHLSETKKEHEECIARWGYTPAQAFEKAGVFRNRVTAAHCVWISPEDRLLLSYRHVGVAHNPVSNLKLASGIAPVQEMLNGGITVGLGTDGMASNNNHDLFEECKLAALLQKERTGHAKILPAAQALTMATQYGARIQGRKEEMGELNPGMDADLMMIDLDRPHLQPCQDLFSTLVYSARGSDVVRTMVKGKTLYQSGDFKTLDKERILYEMNHTVVPRVFGKGGTAV